MAAKFVLPPPTSEQKKAWSFYGNPQISKPGNVTVKDAPISNQVGEVRYIIGWMADQMVRMGWRVTIDGSESWKVTLPDSNEVVTSNAEQSDTESADHPANASRKLLTVIDWDSRTVREVTTNLFVAGELNYVNVKDVWRVVSVIRPDREALISQSTINVRGIWPHPADPDAPDAPLFGVLGVLDDMAWLNRLSRSQSANRVGMRGIIGVADSMATASGAKGAEFWADFEASLSRPMDDPEDMSPVGLIGSAQLVEPKGTGMKGLSWTIPDFPYDDKVDERMHSLVQRLAYGLPIPPEILLGLQAQSKATAFQVEGSTYRAHIEPVALLVSKIATDTLVKFLPDAIGSPEVLPDPTVILARRHSVSDVLDAFDRGAVGYAYVREVLGIPERAEPTDADIALRQRVLGRVADVAGASDPANEAADEPISAAATLPAQTANADPSYTPSADDEWLSDQLHKIDNALLYELVGASTQAISKARERLGARVRANKALKDSIPADLTNEEITLRIGDENLSELGIDSHRIVRDALAAVISWWEKRATKARGDAESLLSEGNVAVEYSRTSLGESMVELEKLLEGAVFDEAALQETALREIVTLAGS